MFTNNKRSLILAFLVFIITVLVFLPALQNGFVNWDDNDYVYDNPHIRSVGLSFFKWAFTSFDVSNWQPLTWISHALDYAVWGLDPMGHHLTSIIMHALNAFLVVMLVMRLVYMVRGKERDNLPLAAGVITGLLFGLHPLHVESVAWVSERKDLLCAFFFLLSMLSYLRYAAHPQSSSTMPKKDYMLCLLFFGLALMSKPMAVTLPVVLVILDIYPIGRLSLKRDFSANIRVLAEKVPFLCLSLASSIITVAAQQASNAITSFESVALTSRVLTAFNALIFYLYKMVWPAELAPLYPSPAEVSFFSLAYSGTFILVVCITAGCILTRKKQKVVSAAWAYYVVTLLPVLGIIQVGSQAAADRYTYLPALGPMLLAGLGVLWLWKKAASSHIKRTFVAGFVILVLTGLSIMTSVQIAFWKDSISLWNRELSLYTSVIAYKNRGNAYLSSGKYQEAIEDYNKAIELYPEYTMVYLNRGVTYLQLGKYREAMEDYNKAIELDPTNPFVYNNRGNIYLSLAGYQEAIADYSKAIELYPEYITAYLNRGICYRKMGDVNKANENFKFAARLGDRMAQEYLESMGIEGQ